MSRNAVRRLSYLAVADVPGRRAHSIQIAKTCEALARRLDEVELVLPRFIGGPGDSPLPQGVRFVRLPAPDFLRLGRWAPQWLMRLLFNVQSVAFALAALMRALLRRRFDVYYTRSPFVAFGFALAFGARVVWELHEPPASATRRLLLRVCRRAGCRFVVVTKALRRVVASSLGVSHDEVSQGEIGVAPNGYDPRLLTAAAGRSATRSRLDLPEAAFVICYVGSAATLGGAKGVGFIVRGFARAALRDAVLVGAGVRVDELPAVPDGVRCLGRLPHDEVLAVPKACDCAVVSFPEQLSHACAMSPLKVFEYLGAGLPLIAPGLPNLREVLDESCALFVPLGDEAALAEAMRRLHDNAPLRERLAAEAAKRAAAYTWDARAGRVLAFLEGAA